MKLPGGPVIDVTKQPEPMAGAIVEVAELGLKAISDKLGQASFTLPAGPKCLPAVFTFVVSTAGSPYKSVVRRIFHAPSGALVLFYRPDEDLYIDESFKRPPKAPVTVVVLDERGIFPVAGAMVTIAETHLRQTTDEHGEADFLLPLGGPWTFVVTRPGSACETRIRKAIFHPEPYLLIRHQEACRQE